MINLDDILDMTDLTREEVAAVAEHEHLPDVNAAALGHYMLHLHHGPQALHGMIADDIRAALHRGEIDHARDLFAVLHHFLEAHPDAERGAAP